MAASGHLENIFLIVLAYNTKQHMLLGVFGVEESISNVSFIIRPLLDPEIQNGRRQPS